MIAVAILGIALLLAAAAFPIGLRQSKDIADTSIARLVADEAFEKIRSEGMPAILEDLETIRRDPDPDISSYTGLRCPGETHRLRVEMPNGLATFCLPLAPRYFRAVTHPDSNLLAPFPVLFPNFTDDSNGMNGTFLTDEIDAGPHDMRTYPAGTPFHKARYCWSFVYRRDDNLNAVQVTVFVMRIPNVPFQASRDTAFPDLDCNPINPSPPVATRADLTIPVLIGDDGEALKSVNFSAEVATTDSVEPFSVMTQVRRKFQSNGPEIDVHLFAEGSYIAELFSGNVYKLGPRIEIEPTLPSGIRVDFEQGRNLSDGPGYYFAKTFSGPPTYAIPGPTDLFNGYVVTPAGNSQNPVVGVFTEFMPF